MRARLHACSATNTILFTILHGSTLALSVCLLIACSRTGAGNSDNAGSYFPLSAGSQWNYAVISEIEGKTQADTHVISVIRESIDNGRQTAVRRSETEGNIGVEYSLRVTPDRIERVAQRMDLNEAAIPDTPPRMVLPLPLKEGTSWRSQTTAYLILRNSEYPRELKYSHKALMTYTVEAIDESVTVPAGTFQHCARIVGQAYLTLYTDPVSGFRKVPLVTTEWYCKGVGLVKLIRTEEISTAFFIGGRSTMELTGYSLR